MKSGLAVASSERVFWQFAVLLGVMLLPFVLLLGGLDLPVGDGASGASRRVGTAASAARAGLEVAPVRQKPANANAVSAETARASADGERMTAAPAR